MDILDILLKPPLPLMGLLFEQCTHRWRRRYHWGIQRLVSTHRGRGSLKLKLWGVRGSWNLDRALSLALVLKIFMSSLMSTLTPSWTFSSCWRKIWKEVQKRNNPLTPKEVVCVSPYVLGYGSVTEMDHNVLNLFIQQWVVFFSSFTVVINKGQQLVYTHTFQFIPTWYYLMIPNTCITFEWLFVHFMNSKPKTCNNVSAIYTLELDYAILLFKSAS